MHFLESLESIVMRRYFPTEKNRVCEFAREIWKDLKIEMISEQPITGEEE